MGLHKKRKVAYPALWSEVTLERLILIRRVQTMSAICEKGEGDASSVTRGMLGLLQHKKKKKTEEE